MFEIIPFNRSTRSVCGYDPFRAIDEMERSFMRNGVPDFRADVSDSGDSFLIEAELPGMKKEDISVDIDGDCLTIKAERKSESQEADDKKNFVRRERYFGSYSRSFDISGVDADAIGAQYTDGVLKLTLPKKAPVTPAARRLEIQ